MQTLGLRSYYTEVCPPHCFLVMMEVSPSLLLVIKVLLEIIVFLAAQLMN